MTEGGEGVAQGGTGRGTWRGSEEAEGGVGWQKEKIRVTAKVVGERETEELCGFDALSFNLQTLSVATLEK